MWRPARQGNCPKGAVSGADADAASVQDDRPIRTGKQGKPTEFGYVSQLAEVTENTKPGGRGLILPASSALGGRAENALLPGTAAELQRLQIRRKRQRSTAGSCPARPTSRWRAWYQERAHRGPPGTGVQTHHPALAALPTGAEGRISHLKRRYRPNRSRLKGDEGQQIWTEWAILAYNADTLAVRTR